MSEIVDQVARALDPELWTFEKQPKDQAYRVSLEISRERARAAIKATFAQLREIDLFELKTVEPMPMFGADYFVEVLDAIERRIDWLPPVETKRK